MKPIVCNEWQIYFHPMFFEQWQELLHEVTRLKAKLDTEKFVTHPQVKLLKALDTGIREKFRKILWLLILRWLARYGNLVA